MLNNLLNFRSSCSLDRHAPTAGGPFDDVHRALRQTPPPTMPAPSALRSRIMDRLRETDAAPVYRIGWSRIARLAAAAAVVVGIGLYIALRPAPAPVRGPGSLALHVPVGVAPVIQLVTDNLDEPLLDQAQKMLSDASRATRAVVQCIPFTSRESR
jgi:hypothetical protein